MRVVCTGTCSTGKTSLLNTLKTKTVIPEIAREWIQFIINEEIQLERKTFQSVLELLHIKRFVDCNDKNEDYIFDRGLPDEIAFRRFFNLEVPDSLIRDCQKYKYDMCFFFPFWKEIFENDSVRKETIEEAELLHTLLYLAYKEVGYNIIVVPKIPVIERRNFVLEQILKHS